jgi:hypothetical protein
MRTIQFESQYCVGHFWRTLLEDTSGGHSFLPTSFPPTPHTRQTPECTVKKMPVSRNGDLVLDAG